MKTFPYYVQVLMSSILLVFDLESINNEKIIELLDIIYVHTVPVFELNVINYEVMFCLCICYVV